jgi:hypothetical protein
LILAFHKFKYTLFGAKNRLTERESVSANCPLSRRGFGSSGLRGGPQIAARKRDYGGEHP